jgi:hypothetical protein
VLLSVASAKPSWLLLAPAPKRITVAAPKPNGEMGAEAGADATTDRSIDLEAADDDLAELVLRWARS